MNKTKMIKTVKKQPMRDTFPLDIANHNYLIGSNKPSGRIRRRTILGEKFDYGEKIKEKQNYVYYVAGQGQEKKEIEEIEELPTNGGKKERIVEEKEIIDNYQYHETKDIKKKHARNSQTQHKRLCDPFERLKIKKYSSYTSEPRKGGYKIIRTTNLVDKNDYSRDYLHNTNKNNIHLNSLTVQPQRRQNVNRVESYSNLSNSSSTNDSIKGVNRINNINKKNNDRRPNSNGVRITNFSKYERKKVNGIEKVDNYSINNDKNKKNLIPQNTIKYKYDKDTDNIPKPNNYKCNRIPINISKYSKPKTRKNSPFVRVETNNKIKLDSKSQKEKSLNEGPKYQLLGKDLPKDKPRPNSYCKSRTRSNRVRKQRQSQSHEKKGYIPFGGRGTKVGGSPIYIPRPTINRLNNHKLKHDNSYNLNEKNTTYTENSIRSTTKYTYNINTNNSTINNNSSSNIRGMKDFQRTNVNKCNNNGINSRKKINNTKNYQRTQKNITKIQNYDNKFPGKGTRVGCSGINRSELISESNNSISYAQYKKFEKENMDILEVPGKKNENIRCFEQSLCFQGEQNGMQKSFEETIEEDLCYRGENEEIFKEIFCPMHGRQIIRIKDSSN